MAKEVGRITMRTGNYPQWMEDHKNEKVTVSEWLEIIADYYPADFVHNQPGRPSMLSKDTALQLYGEFANTGFLKYALEKVGLHRSTVWRWRRRYRSIHDMHFLVETFIRYQKEKFPQFWRKTREMQLRVLRRKSGRLLSLKDITIGRPPVYDPLIHTDVESSLEDTAKKFGLCKRTIQNWVKNYPEFERDTLLTRLQWLLPTYEKLGERYKKEDEAIHSRYPHINSSNLAEQDLDNGSNTISSKK